MRRKVELSTYSIILTVAAIFVFVMAMLRFLRNGPEWLNCPAQRDGIHQL